MQTAFLQALRTIDDYAVSQEPSAEPTVSVFPPGSERYGDDAAEMREAFEQGQTRGFWEAAEIARKALAQIHTPDVPPTFQRLEFLEAGTHAMEHNQGRPLTIAATETHDDLAQVFCADDTHGSAITREQAVAYAHLFAAAPAMLAALYAAETMLAKLPDVSTNWNGERPSTSTARALAQVRASIAAAEGRTLTTAAAPALKTAAE